MNPKNEGIFQVKQLTEFSTPGARADQEDFVITDRTKQVFAVADGFGGRGPGAEASRVACESVKSFLFKEAGDLDATLPFEIRPYFSLVGNVLFNALIHVIRTLSGLIRDRSLNARGGTSMVAGFVDDGLLALAGVGAVEAWLLRGDQSVQLIRPQTYGALWDPFSVQARAGELQSAPLRALGMADSLEPELVEVRLRPGDWLLLHTDGLSAQERATLIASKGPSSDPAVASVWAEGCRRKAFEENTSFVLVCF